MISHKYKIHDRNGEYVAACKYLSAAAVLITLYGDGSTIRYGHNDYLWKEGEEFYPAHGNYGFVQQQVHNREEVFKEAARQRPKRRK